MLSQISWSLFFGIAALALVIYYSFVGLVFYPKEILGLLLEKPQKQTVPATGSTVPADIIGTLKTSQQTDHKRFIPVADIGPAPAEPTADITMVGTVADLTNALDTLIGVIADAEGGPSDIEELMPGLLRQYAPVAGSKYRHSINTLIRERCQAKLAADIPPETIDRLWPLADINN